MLEAARRFRTGKAGSVEAHDVFATWDAEVGTDQVDRVRGRIPCVRQVRRLSQPDDVAQGLNFSAIGSPSLRGLLRGVAKRFLTRVSRQRL